MSLKNPQQRPRRYIMKFGESIYKLSTTEDLKNFELKSDSDIWKTSCGVERENLQGCTSCSAVTTLCRFHGGVAEVCVLPSAIKLFPLH